MSLFLDSLLDLHAVLAVVDHCICELTLRMDQRIIPQGAIVDLNFMLQEIVVPIFKKDFLKVLPIWHLKEWINWRTSRISSL